MTSAIFLLLLAQQVIPLRPAVPNAPPDKIEERGTPALPDRSINSVAQPDVTVYLPDAAKSTGRAIVICPGGAYTHLAIDKEGHELGRWLQSIGYAGIVLKYRLPGGMKGTMESVAEAVRVAHEPIEDAQDAIKLARANAAKWNLKTNAIGIMGFSAGGNLAALVAITAPEESRPDFVVLGYPAIPQQLTEVPATTPPTFLVHADDDRLAAGDNSVRFYQAMKRAKRPAELHIYATGGHGFGIRKANPAGAAWTTPLEAWLRALPLN